MYKIIADGDPGSSIGETWMESLWSAHRSCRVDEWKMPGRSAYGFLIRFCTVNDS